MKCEHARPVRSRYYIILILTLLLIPSCMFMKPDKLNLINSNELHQLMKRKDIFLVDVHIPEQQHIEGTDLFLPFHEIEDNLDKFPGDKNVPIYLYCESGPMGNYAARTLLDAGYSEIYNLKSGASEWLDSGYNLRK